MARKPVHLTANAKRPEGRQVMWEAMRTLRTFTIADLSIRTELKESTLRSYVEGLTKAGYLRKECPTERVGGTFPAATWTLERDIGIEAPKVKRNGEPVTGGLGREQMWRTMRIVGEFDFHELAVQASTEAHLIAENEARCYCLWLSRAGYLATTREGGPNLPTRYRLLPSRYTGPLAPQVQRIHQVWDPNTQQVVYRPEDGSDE